MSSQEQASRPPVLAAFSPDSPQKEALEFGLAAAERTGARLVIGVVRQGGPLASAMGGDVEDVPGSGRSMEHLREGLRRRGLKDVEVKTIDSRSIVGGLKKAIEEVGPELVVLGSSSQGRMGAVMVGSTTQQLIREATVPVAVVPKGYQRPDHGLSVIGAAFADTDEGAQTLRAAAKLAGATGARLRAVTVTAREPGDDKKTENRARGALGDLAEGVELEVDVQSGSPADGLIAASQGVDLLVMGGSGRGSRRSALLGSAESKVPGQAGCPVLVLPPRASEASDALIGRVEPVRTA